MVETRGTLPKALWPGVKAWWGADYKQYPEVCKQIFEVQKSTMAWEEDVQITGMNAAKVKDEGGSTEYDNIGQGFTSRYTHLALSNGFIVTREEFKDNQYKKVARARTKELSKSFRVAKETLAASVFNNAHTTFQTGDGVSLLNTAHPEKMGTFSNKLAVAADLSESSLEDLCIQIMNATDSVGDPIHIEPKQLIIPTSLTFEAERILKSAQRVGTDHNDINALKSLGVLQNAPIVWRFLTDTDAFYIKTDVSEGLKHYQREAREISREGDFDTDNLKVKGYERYSFGATNPRCLYGSEGA